MAECPSRGDCIECYAMVRRTTPGRRVPVRDPSAISGRLRWPHMHCICSSSGSYTTIHNHKVPAPIRPQLDQWHSRQTALKANIPVATHAPTFTSTYVCTSVPSERTVTLSHALPVANSDGSERSYVQKYLFACWPPYACTCVSMLAKVHSESHFPPRRITPTCFRGTSAPA